MPGAIQVSVLDFSGLESTSSSPSPTSQISLKVSMGKREYQTADKGEFSFPLTSLRENLVVILQDSQGNEISRTGVETRLVIEKGVWDDIFPLEGGGQVLMKLQFVLSEEDRHRIRVMRESALRKKHDELLSAEPRSPETATAGGSKVGSFLRTDYEISDSILPREMVATTAGILSTSRPTLFKNANSATGNMERTHFVQKKWISDDTDRFVASSTTVSQDSGINPKELRHRNLITKNETWAHPIDFPVRTASSGEASCSGSSGLVVSVGNITPAKPKGDGASDSEKQCPKERTPSKVRTMISAFESSLNQDSWPKIKSQLGSTDLDFPSGSSHLNEVKRLNLKTAESLSGRVGSPLHARNEQRSQILTRKAERQTKNELPESLHLGDLRQGPKHITGAKSSQDARKLEDRTDGSSGDSQNKLKMRSTEARIEEHKLSSGDMMRASTSRRASFSGRMIIEHLGRLPFRRFFAGKQESDGNPLMNKNRKGQSVKGSQDVNTKGASGDEHYSFEYSGPWVFPDEGKRFCITAGGKEIMNLMGGFLDQGTSQQGETSSVACNVMDVLSSSIAGNVKQFDMHHTEAIHEETSQRVQSIDPEGSTDDATPRGPVGQVMRVAIMVGFAALVLFTRQRKPER